MKNLFAFSYKKRRGKFSGFVLWQFHLGYYRSRFLVLAVNAIAHKVTTAVATATETSATLLNSGTFGVGEAVATVVVAVLITETVPLTTFVT